MRKDGKHILKQELIVTDCELQAELEDNYNDKLRQKLTEKATICSLVSYIAIL